MPRKRRLRLLLFILLLAAAGWLAWRCLNPRLTPVTVRHYQTVFFRYSANGYGYPAIQVTPDMRYDGEVREVQCLDDRGQILSGPAVPDLSAVSPTRQVLAWSHFDP